MIRYAHLIHRTAHMYGNCPAIVCGDRTRTVAQVAERAFRLGRGLRARGVGPGDRVGVLLPNCAEYMEIDVGLASAGLVRVSLNVRSTASQQQAVLRDAEARVLIYSEPLASIADEILAELSPEIVVCLDGRTPDRDVVDYERLLADAAEAPLRPDDGPDPDPGDLYCLFYTSGTTGEPKGVKLSHRAYMAVAFNLLLEFGPVRPGDRIVLTQPLSHGGGFFMLPWLISGATCVVMERFEPERCVELVQEHRAQTLKVVPTMLLQMLAAGVTGNDLPTLRKIIYGASPMPAQRTSELLQRFGPIFAQLYGQAEAPMCITVLPEKDHLADDGALLSSAGRPWRNVEVRVVDEDGRDVDVGDSGEVVVRGEHIMSGYWRRPKLSDQILAGGYVHTRDIARHDERGYVYLLGRSDEMINSGGFNVAPREVEATLDRHPAIHESFVLGMPHEQLGEEVTAFVALRPGQSATPEEIIDYARENLGYRKPRAVWIVPSLPRNAYGKVLKAELRQQVLRGSLSR